MYIKISLKRRSIVTLRCFNLFLWFLTIVVWLVLASVKELRFHALEQRVEASGLVSALHNNVNVVDVTLGELPHRLLELHAAHHELRLGHAERVREQLTAQVRVDESRDDAELAQTEPHARVLELVLHEERHHVTLAQIETLREEMRYLVAIVLQLRKIE